MILNSPAEIIKLQDYSSTGNPDYMPTFISTQKAGASTSMGYWQIGSTQQHGNNYSPVYKMIFLDLDNVTATHIKIWAVDNKVDAEAPEIPVSYLKDNPEFKVYLNKFEFTDGNGNITAPGGTYNIIGCKKRQYPISY